MAGTLKMNNRHNVVSRLRTFMKSPSTHSPVHKGPRLDRISPETDPDYSSCRGRIDISKWKTLDARKLGIANSMISQQSWFVLKLLQKKGFQSYLVGGCVRDLLLNRTPKDFDVITTAKLIEVRNQFRRAARASRAEVVGRRFPVCLVHIKDSVVEVTSFETVAQTSKRKEQLLSSLLPKCSNKKDLILCKNSLHRDFTINSLFYDPFDNKIYDYANGLADLRTLKLETVIPAQLSFKEDPGRILRGFRITARLGLSLSRETEAGIWRHSSLVQSLDKNKIMIEMNYMLSYGAAEPSLRLLWEFKLLDFLLPIHAAYLDEQATKEDAKASNMLMKLFFHLDNLVACDRPSDSTLWIGLLSFHLALVNNPQDALVVWALASVLYHGEWEEGIKFAKECAKMCVNFAPEIRASSICKSDEELAKAVTKLASLVMNSIPALVENNSLLEFMSKYPSRPLSGMVFVPRKTGKVVSEIFKVLAKDVKSYKSKRKNLQIYYYRLGKGHPSEIRFVLGKILLDTMNSGIVGDRQNTETEKCHFKTEGTKETGQLQPSDVGNHQFVARKDKRPLPPIPTPNLRKEINKKQKLVDNKCTVEQKMGSENHELIENYESKETNEEHQKLRRNVDVFITKGSLPERENSRREKLANDSKKITTANKSSLDEATLKKKKSHLSDDEVFNEKGTNQQHKSKQSSGSLSSYFK